MIKGIFLENKPEMEKVTDCDILSSLDPIMKESEDETFGGESGDDIVKRNFSSPDYNISSYTIRSRDRLDSMWTTLSSLSTAGANLFKAFMYGENTIITAYPKYGDQEIDFKYTRLINELLRFTAFCLRDTGWNKEVTIERIFEYIDMCIYWPGKQD